MGILLRGNVGVRFGARESVDFADSDGFALSSPEPVEMRHRFYDTSDVRIVFLVIPDEIVDSVSDFTARFGAKSAHPQFQAWKPNVAVLSVAHQIANCSLVGPLRELYLQGKSLEMLSLGFGCLLGSGVDQNAHRKLKAGHIERLNAAHDILRMEFRTPPSLDVLARRVGICTTALTSGFRQIYGMSVTEFIQDLRLGEAFRSLSDGDMTVSQAAYSVGMSPAYFSTLFRRRYGLSPSNLTARK
jgi:AraC family transcriptional activator of pyochelin receptor